MKPTDDQLKIINSRIPEPVTSDMVEILPFMVFDQAVTDRYTVATPEFLRKMVMDINDGRVALNTLHQSRTTLPVGRSVNGVFKDGKAYANMYAVIKNHDGSIPEDGKVLADKYNTGAVFAASAGINAGFYKCSICGFDIFDYENCKHWPGESYIVDENKPPQRCIAYMTGHDIQNGVAMDCSCYEVSAVTAGGVANAGLTRDQFSAYDGTDLVEFKKSHEKTAKDAFAKHALTLAVTTQFDTTNGRSEENMTLKKEDVLEIIKAEYGDLPSKYTELENAKKDVDAAYAKLTADHTTTVSEYEALKTEVAALKAEAETFKAAEDELVAFKNEFIAVVTADAVRAGKASEGLESKTCAELQAYHKECLEVIAGLPAGQHTVDTGVTKEYQIDLNNCY